QLAYLLPRLTRMWVHLSRIRGGIGLRGPGETQLETDRRMIRTKIGKLKKDLTAVTEHRARLRERSRDRGVIKVALVGYTNAGKSSLLRALTGAAAHVEDRLFATLDTASREIEMRGTGGQGDGGTDTARKIRFTDTVGFIRKLPHDLVASFRSTLEEAADSDVLIHVVDVAHHDWQEQIAVVNQTLEEAGLSSRPIVMALNKADLLDEPTKDRRRREAEEMGFEAALVSAMGQEGVTRLMDEVSRKM
ncbi:MAG: GTPase HflX, partial [Gemmatimonadetes bacterium GWC2_71_10]